MQGETLGPEKQEGQEPPLLYVEADSARYKQFHRVVARQALVCRYAGVDDVIELADGSLIFTDYAVDTHDDRLPKAQLPYNV